MPVTWLKRLAGTALSASVLCFSGCYSLNGHMLNASGMNLYGQGNYALAAQDFQTAVANSPNNPDYISNLAKARMKLGDGTGAEQLFRQALTTNPSHQPSYHGLSELMLAQGRGQEANQMLQTWAATQPYVAESHIELAWIQQQLGQPDAAVQSLQEALQTNPNHPTALAHLGQFYHDNGQPQQAVAMYQRSLQADWDQPHVHNRLAAVAQSAGATHPMGQIAMARGVHPHSVPRQELALGAGAQNIARQDVPFNATQVASTPTGLGFLGQPPMTQQTLMPPAGLQAQSGFPPSLSGSLAPVPSPFSPAPHNVAGNQFTNSQSSFAAHNQVPAPAPDLGFNNLPPIAGQNSLAPVNTVSASRPVEDDLIELDAF